MKLSQIAILAGSLLPLLDVSAASLKASYYFEDTLSAQEATAPALSAVNPLGLNAFENATDDLGNITDDTGCGASTSTSGDCDVGGSRVGSGGECGGQETGEDSSELHGS